MPRYTYARQKDGSYTQADRYTDIKLFLFSPTTMTLRNFFSEVLADKQIRANTFITLSINTILWIAILIKTQGQTRPLPLHFNAFYGIELVDSGLWLFIIPGAGLILTLMNLWLAKQVGGYDIFLARVLAYGGTTLHLLLAVAVASIFAVSA